MSFSGLDGGSVYDTFMSDTFGAIYRAGTGNVDPWTKNELVDKATQANIQAGMDPTVAAQQAHSDVTNTLSTFTLGGSDPVGADPSQTTGIRLPSSTAFMGAIKSAFNDNGTGCGITNLGGCFPPWVPYVVIGAGVLFALWILRPYIGLVEES